jgi:predicted small lipoprotein YifL
MIRLCVLIAALALSACGKYGPNDPPGPASEVTYPKIYPTQ